MKRDQKNMTKLLVGVIVVKLGEPVHRFLNTAFLKKHSGVYEHRAMLPVLHERSANVRNTVSCRKKRTLTLRMTLVGRWNYEQRRDAVRNIISQQS